MSELKNKKIDDAMLDDVYGGVNFKLWGDNNKLWSATEENERIKGNDPDPLGVQGMRTNNPGGVVGA